MDYTYNFTGSVGKKCVSDYGFYCDFEDHGGTALKNRKWVARADAQHAVDRFMVILSAFGYQAERAKVAGVIGELLEAKSAPFSKTKRFNGDGSYMLVKIGEFNQALTDIGLAASYKNKGEELESTIGNPSLTGNARLAPPDKAREDKDFHNASKAFQTAVQNLSNIVSSEEHFYDRTKFEHKFNLVWVCANEHCPEHMCFNTCKSKFKNRKGGKPKVPDSDDSEPDDSDPDQPPTYNRRKRALKMLDSSYDKYIISKFVEPSEWCGLENGKTVADLRKDEDYKFPHNHYVILDKNFWDDQYGGAIYRMNLDKKSLELLCLTSCKMVKGNSRAVKNRKPLKIVTKEHIDDKLSLVENDDYLKIMVDPTNINEINPCATDKNVYLHFLPSTHKWRVPDDFTSARAIMIDTWENDKMVYRYVNMPNDGDYYYGTSQTVDCPKINRRTPVKPDKGKGTRLVEVNLYESD